jgi:hypothetical protein
MYDNLKNQIANTQVNQTKEEIPAHIHKKIQKNTMKNENRMYSFSVQILSPFTNISTPYQSLLKAHSKP